MKQRDVSVWQEERAKEFCEEWYKTQVKKDHKIVVIDDDPTGTQTVHDVPVYTAYDLEHIRKGFKEETPLFYVLTNSRSLKQKDCICSWEEILHRLQKRAVRPVL